VEEEGGVREAVGNWQLAIGQKPNLTLMTRFQI
jgi:hypothetical protein